MASIVLQIPESDLPAYAGGSIAAAVKNALATILAGDHPPYPNVSLDGPTQQVPVWLPGTLHDSLQGVAEAWNVNDAAKAAELLLHAAAAKDLPPTVVPSGDSTLDAMNRAVRSPTRAAQTLFYRAVTAALRDGKDGDVVFAEASTGVGKTRAFIAAVLDNLPPAPQVAVVAAPSYNVLRQALEEWTRLETKGAMPPHEVLLGMQEYVSAQALRDLLDGGGNIANADRAREWLAAGGPAPDGDPLGRPWLLRGLRAHCNEMFEHDAAVSLTRSAAVDDPGMAAYRGQFDDARETRVVFCTHAMLAVDTLRRRQMAAVRDKAKHGGKTASSRAWDNVKALREMEPGTKVRKNDVQHAMLAESASDQDGRLPPIGLLVVDEAHLLEQAFARVCSHGIAVSRMLRAARVLHDEFPRAVRASDVDGLQFIWNELRAIGVANGGETVDAATNESAAKAIHTMGEWVKATLSRVRGKAAQTPAAGYLRMVAEAVRKTHGYSRSLTWSPNVQWPSVDIGRYDVSQELSWLWTQVVTGKSVLVSATLYDDMTGRGVEGMRHVLSVPAGAVKALPPVRPQWLYAPVTLNMVREPKASSTRLRRPTKGDRLTRAAFAARTEKWRDEVAGYIRDAWATAAGGVLVLLTSHADREAIADRVRSGVPANCVIEQVPGKGLDAVRRDFLGASAKGLRPCLLGVGASWTGLDLSGEVAKASDDNVLTDLIVPLIPFGTNRTLTHAHRRRFSFAPEVADVSIMFRQGCGRLVRREGVPANRRLHILDPRAHDPRWSASFVERVLAPYPRRREV